jgi:hypothetical protein
LKANVESSSSGKKPKNIQKNKKMNKQSKSERHDFPPSNSNDLMGAGFVAPSMTPLLRVTHNACPDHI